MNIFVTGRPAEGRSMTILTIAQAQPSLVPASFFPIFRYPARNVRSGAVVSPRLPWGALALWATMHCFLHHLYERGLLPTRASPVGIPFHGKYYIPSHIHFHFANRRLDRPASCEFVGHPLGGVCTGQRCPVFILPFFPSPFPCSSLALFRVDK